LILGLWHVIQGGGGSQRFLLLGVAKPHVRPILLSMETEAQDRKIAAGIPTTWNAYHVYSLTLGAYHVAGKGFIAKMEGEASLYAYNEANLIAGSISEGEAAFYILAII